MIQPVRGLHRPPAPNDCRSLPDRDASYFPAPRRLPAFDSPFALNWHHWHQVLLTSPSYSSAAVNPRGTIDLIDPQLSRNREGEQSATFQALAAGSNFDFIH